MRNLTYVFGASGIGGVLFAILAEIRWAFNFPDPSNAVFGIGIGIAWAILSFGFGYMYEKLSGLVEKHRSMEMRLDSLVFEKNAEKEKKEWKNQKSPK